MVKHTGNKDAHQTQIPFIYECLQVENTTSHSRNRGQLDDVFIAGANTTCCVFYFGIRIRTRLTRSHPWEFIYIHLFPLLMYYYSLLPKTEATYGNEYTVEVSEQSNSKSLKNRFIILVRITAYVK